MIRKSELSNKDGDVLIRFNYDHPNPYSIFDIPVSSKEAFSILEFMIKNWPESEFAKEFKMENGIIKRTDYISKNKEIDDGDFCGYNE